jgi:hypothetical protein
LLGFHKVDLIVVVARSTVIVQLSDALCVRLIWRSIGSRRSGVGFLVRFNEDAGADDRDAPLNERGPADHTHLGIAAGLANAGFLFSNAANGLTQIPT